MKVVDLSSDVAGRFAAKLLAMSGAEVLRPIAANDDPSARPLDLYLDAGKQALAAEQMTDALAGSDLIFTSFDRGNYLGWARNRAALPAGAVEVTTSSFGLTGPYSAYHGGPLADWAAGGYLWITGEPGREPLMGPEHLCGYVAGYAAALGAEAALRARARDGLGRQVDIATMDVMLGLHQSTFSRASAGYVRHRTGRYAEIYPLTVLPCRTGYVSLGVVSDEEFDRLTIAFGVPGLLADERFASRDARLAHCDALDVYMLPYLQQHDAAQVVETLQVIGVASTVAAEPGEVLDNPQLCYRGFWASPAGREDLRMPGNPVPASIRFASGAIAPRGDKTALANSARDTRGLPLDGLVVLDLTAFWAGPSATRILADLGAEVIWIERPKSRIDFNDMVTDPLIRGFHLFHEKLNRHKRSIVLDLETPEGRATARDIAARADVVVENFRPGVAAKLGLGPEELCSAYPELVYVSLSGFGSAGPWGNWRSFGPNIEAASSIIARTGYAGEQPMRLGHALPDGVGGVAGALAVLRGLRERDEKGHGGWFDISQLEVYAAIGGEDILDSAMNGTAFPRIGNRSRTGAIQGVFPCQGEDEWIAIRLCGEDEIERFVAATGVSMLADAAARSPIDHDACESAIRDYAKAFGKHDLAARLQAAGLEALPVFRPDELLSDGHVTQREIFVRAACGGSVGHLPASPIRSSPRLTNSEGPAPRFGQHTAEIAKVLAAGAGPS